MTLRPPACWALDPLTSVTNNGRVVHRHCRRPQDHEPPHLTTDMWGDPVHAWWWADDHDGKEEAGSTAAAPAPVVVVPSPPEQLTL